MVPDKTQVFIKSLDEINDQINKYREKMDNIRQSMDANDVHTDYDEEGKGELLGDFEKYASYLNNAQKMKETLQKINRKHYSEGIQFGSVIETKDNYYFVAVPLGDIRLDDGSIVNVISTEAPIFEKLKGKKKGDTFKLKDEEIKILGVH